MTHVRLSMKNLGFSIGFSLRASVTTKKRETTNTIKKKAEQKDVSEKYVF